MAAPNPPPTHLYKILSPPPSLAKPLPPARALPSTPLDVKDGFIHLSTSSQVPFVLGKFFRDDTSRAVALVKIDYAKLCAGEGEVRWEKAGSSVFAHLYGGDVRGSVVVDVRDVQRDGEDWDSVLNGLQEQRWFEG